jgi:outer membrane protein assembly factor BamB
LEVKKLLALCLLVILTNVCFASDLARFLPANGNNLYQAEDLLDTWPAAGPDQLWRMAIGYGKSGVAETQGRLFTATQTDKKQYAVCMDPATGKIIWKKLLLPKENNHRVKGPVSSPLADGDRVYFFPYDSQDDDFWRPRCPILCLRAEDGTVVWSEDKAFNCSEGSTPLIVDDILYIGGGGRENALAAVDKLTGRLLWKVAEDRDAGSKHVYVTGSSIVCQDLGGIKQIIVSVYQNDLMGVNALTGEVMWHWKFENATASGMVPTPVAIGPRLLLSASQGQNYYSICLEMKVKDGKVAPVMIYQSERLQCNMYHTPSVYDGAVFGFGKSDQGDTLQCTDFKDGRLLWEKQGIEWNRESQLTIADGLIFAINKNEELVLIEADRTAYKEKGRFDPGLKLGIPQQPMIVNGNLYLRGDDTLACYRIAKKNLLIPHIH